jgi:hypothetical protein
MGHERPPYLREQQIAGRQNASTQDEDIRFEETDIPGGSSTQPATNFAIDLQGYAVTPDGLFCQQLGTEVFTIKQPLLQAGLLATPQGALHHLLHGIHGDQSIDAASFATAATGAAGRDQHVADMANVLWNRAFHFAIDNQRGTNYGIDRQEEQAIKSPACTETVLSQ